MLGRVGCATCLIGSVVIVLHAPPDKEVKDVNELLSYALMPGEYMIHPWGDVGVEEENMGMDLLIVYVQASSSTAQSYLPFQSV